MDNIKFINFFPNIWICYLDKPINKKNTSQLTTILKKFCSTKNIKKVIRIDKDTTFWMKSSVYIQDIKKELEFIEINNLIKYYNTIHKTIYTNYYNNTETIIISGHNLEIVYGLLMTYLYKYGDMTPINSYKGIVSKFNTDISISNEMKLLLKMYMKIDN